MFIHFMLTQQVLKSGDLLIVKGVLCLLVQKLVQWKQIVCLQTSATDTGRLTETKHVIYITVKHI